MPMAPDSQQSLFAIPPLPTCNSQLIKEQIAIPSTALGILRFYGDKVQQIAEEKPPESDKSSNNHVLDDEKSSSSSSTATGIMKLARSRLMELNMKDADVFTIIAVCFGDTYSEDFEDFEISVILQAAAEKISYNRFSCAKKLLALCNHSAFKTGNPVQRTVFYFTRALKQRIDRQIGACLDLNLSQNKKPIDVIHPQISLKPETIAHQQQFSVTAISQITGIQSILDNVASVKKIHVIDFRIRNGWQWTILMQSLAIRRNVPVEFLKITAVGTSKEVIEETGRWLSSFAESMNLSFSFHLIVSEMEDLKEDMFHIKPDETLVIFSSVCLFSLVAFPSQLESFICMIKNLKPYVLILNEVDQSTDSSIFTERFTKSLFYISALLECLSVCGGKGSSYTKLAEEVNIWEMIQNIVVAEGVERVHRHETLSFWRALFLKFGFFETMISSSVLHQANLMVKCSPGKRFYNLGMDDKCMTLGWKGTPLEFLSVWKSHRQEKINIVI